MKWITTTILALFACLSLTLAAGSASASPVHPVTHSAHILCTEYSAGEVDPPNGHAAVWWVHNTRDCGFYIRVKLSCANRFTGDVTEYGGFVEERYPVQSGKKCPASHSALQRVWQQVKFTSGGSLHTCERYPTNQCPGSDPARTYTYYHG